MGFLSGSPRNPAPIIDTNQAVDPTSVLGPRPDTSYLNSDPYWRLSDQGKQVQAAADAWDKQAQQITAQGVGKAPGYLQATAAPTPNTFSGQMGTQAGIQQQGLANALQTRGQTQGLIGDLQAQAAGQGPSLAQNQLKEATDRNANLAAGALASQRGINPALAARMITQQQSNVNQQAAGQSADLRMQEQMAARQQLAGILGQQQGMDLGYGAQGLQGAGMYGQLGLGYDQIGSQLSEANKNRQMQIALANQQAQLHTADTNAGISSSNNSQAASVAGGAIGAIGAGAMMLSDERAKSHIAPAGPALDQFMDSMGEHSYQYKDPSNGPGTRYGPMAQEMEKSAVGRSIVQDTPQGKAVDMRAALSAALAGQARLNERLEALEGGKKMAMGGPVPPPGAPMNFGQKLGGVMSAFGSGMTGSPGFNPGLVQIGQALRQKQQAMQAAQPTPIVAQPGNYGIGDALQSSSFAAPQPPSAPMPQPSASMMAPQAPSPMPGGGGPAAMKGGGRVPGHAEVSGDSERNDKVPALLSPGEIVIPRSKAKDPDQAKAFVEAIANHKGPEDEPEGYGKVLQHTRDLHERLKKIEHALGGMVY